MHSAIDTPPEVAEKERARIMALSGTERFYLGAEMFDAARRLILASLPSGLSEFERKRHLYERIYGEPLPRGMVEKLAVGNAKA